MTEKKNPVGRPRKIKSPEEFDALVDSYIDLCKSADPPEPVLLTGMCLALGLYGKEALAEYAEYPEFTLSVKRARTLIEMEYEKRLNVNSAAAGPIFALKNFGWKDKVEQEMYGKDGGPVMQPVLQIVTTK